MALSRSSRRVARVLTSAVLAAAAFAGVSLASRSAHAQGVYVYRPYYRPAPPPGAYYGPQPRPYYAPPDPAQAFQLGFDLEGAIPVGVNVPGSGTSPNDLRGGVGFKVRAGEQLAFPGAVRFTPEVGYAYDHLWANDDNNNQYGWDMNRLFAGARIDFGRILVPVLYAHLGYGWRQVGTGWSTYNVSGGNGGLEYDFGGALDLHLVPHFNFGVHLDYNAIDIPYQPQWVSIGGHANLLFW